MQLTGNQVVNYFRRIDVKHKKHITIPQKYFNTLQTKFNSLDKIQITMHKIAYIDKI